MSAQDVGFVLLTLAFSVIGGCLSWMAIQVKRWIVRTWSALLDGCAIEMR